MWALEQGEAMPPELHPLLKKLEQEDPTMVEPKLTIEQWQELLVDTLEKNGTWDQLKTWLLELAMKAKRLLLELHQIFSLEPNEIGCTDATECVIELLDDEPFKEQFQRIAPPLVEEVWQNLQDLLDGGAIWLSQSPWCNAVVLVRKKDGSLRFCIDFRQLNSCTKKDAYPLPWMQKTMDSMVGSQHFSCMDLKSGFWQMKMSEKSQQYTAFTVGSMEVFEFLQMLYRLCNALVTFQRLMQNCLRELNLTYTLIYLYSWMEDDHLTQLRAVFE